MLVSMVGRCVVCSPGYICYLVFLEVVIGIFLAVVMLFAILGIFIVRFWALSTFSWVWPFKITVTGWGPSCILPNNGLHCISGVLGSFCSSINSV